MKKNVKLFAFLKEKKKKIYKDITSHPNNSGIVREWILSFEHRGEEFEIQAVLHNQPSFSQESVEVRCYSGPINVFAGAKRFEPLEIEILNSQDLSVFRDWQENIGLTQSRKKVRVVSFDYEGRAVNVWNLSGALVSNIENRVSCNDFEDDFAYQRNNFFVTLDYDNFIIV